MCLAQSLYAALRYNLPACTAEPQIGLYLPQVDIVANGDRFRPRRSAPGAAGLFADLTITCGRKLLVCIYIQQSK